jgi:prepilin-type N-terminal cleavage/methylation domain-containing protein
MKNAFTMIELIFVVVIIGIVSAVSYGSFQRDELAEATHQVLEHIRYTQHLALTENKFDPMDARYISLNFPNTRNGTFHRGRWQIRFQIVPNSSGASGYSGYSIYSDFDRQGGIDHTTQINPATNPLDKKLFALYDNCSNCSEDIFLSRKFNISNISFSANCLSGGSPPGFSTVSSDVGSIIFDTLGRPYYGIGHNNGALAVNQQRIYEYKLTQDCSITLYHISGRTASITVKPESGYAFIYSIN